jgi:hypothetical protein
MIRAALLLAGALAIAGAAPAQEVREGSVPNTMLAPADGWDIDALLRRAREQEQRYIDRRYPEYLDQQQRATVRRELPAAQQRELDARRVYEAERGRVQLESGGPPKSAGERILERDTLQRQQLDAERARRAYDDSIPNLWRR